MKFPFFCSVVPWLSVLPLVLVSLLSVECGSESQDEGTVKQNTEGVLRSQEGGRREGNEREKQGDERMCRM